MIGIYKITSPKDRIYIGQSRNIEKRIHDYKFMRGCKTQLRLYRSFLKHGVDNHTFEVIEECNIELLSTRERHWQDYYNVLVLGLNCKLSSANDKPGFLSSKTRKKISESHKGKTVSLETRMKMSESRKGSKNPSWGKSIKPSLETRKKMSESKSGSKNNMFGKVGTRLGKKCTPETRMKMSESAKGLKKSESHKKNLSIANSGWKSHRAKIVLDTSTGIFYGCAKEAAFVAGINPSTFTNSLNRYKGKVNKTNYVYV